MPTPRKLTKALEAHVLAQAGAGKSTRAIAAWLERSKGVRISNVQVAAFLRERRRSAGQAEAAKVAVRAHLAKQLPVDLEAFTARSQALQTDLEAIEVQLRKLPLNSPEWCRLQKIRIRMFETYRRAVDTKLHYTGADAPEEAVDGVAGLFALAFDAA